MEETPNLAAHEGHSAEEAAPMIPDDIQGCSPTTQRVLPSSLIISPGHCHVLRCSPSTLTLGAAMRGLRPSRCSLPLLPKTAVLLPLVNVLLLFALRLDVCEEQQEYV
ncbi:hypothetical protein U9M48_043329 [Paspalum notatum var. saurae]|uniref:Uncharacterized protein n=1 Tax=Paspalum notatum var. saurae TaxID=547442 RepID=A0AAQ3UUG3_PASNO